MNILYKIAFALISVTSISSCTKVIDVDIKDSESLYVIEAYVTLGETEHLVKITKSQNLSASTDFPDVNDAVVTISDNFGNAQNLTFISPGVYSTSAYPVFEGRTYTLSVNVGQNVFIAQDQMPSPVVLDTVETFPFAFGPTEFNSIVPVRLDPAGIKNYYQFKLKKGNNYLSGIFLQSDQYNDGNIMLEPIFADGINKGDTISVEMYGITKPVYDFFFTLLQNEQGATPANPTSNFSGNCLGFFSTRTKQVKNIIIPL